MAKVFRISIRSKILVVLSALVIASVALYLYLASRIFSEDKTLVIYELNQTNVRTLAAEVESRLQRLANPLTLMTAVADPSELARRLPEWFGGSGTGLLRVGVMRAGVSKPEVIGSWTSALGSEANAESWLSELRTLYPIPVERVVHDGIWVRNVTPPDEAENAVMTLAVPLPGKSPPDIAYADLLIAGLGSAFERRGIAEVYLSDSEGHVLAHPDPALVLANATLTSDPLIQAARAAKVRGETRKLAGYLGSFQKLERGDLIVASRISENEAFSAARVLIRRSWGYALLVVTAAFLVALFLAHSLTAPILALVEATRRIAQGDLDQKVAVGAHDELSILAKSFNSMTSRLRESRSQIEEYSRGLEEKVAERTSKLEAQNRAIQEAQEALVRTTRLASVGEIAGRAAHEVLNPLTSLSARLESIRGRGISEEVGDLKLFEEIIDAWKREAASGGAEALTKSLQAPSQAFPGKVLLDEDLDNLEAILKDSRTRSTSRAADVDFLLREAGRIGKIVNGMRSLTRVSGNRKQIDVSEFLDELAMSWKDLFRKSGLELELVSTDSTLAVLADPDELNQVLGNLLRNSMQALEHRGEDVSRGSVKVTAKRAGSRVRIEVADNGPGIPSADHERIFDASFTTKEADEGTGLGLSICRRFVRSWGGEIVLEKSEPGQETVFAIELPEATMTAKETG